MNILILTHSFPEETNTWRGTFVYDQAAALSKEHNVTVLFFKGDNSKISIAGKPEIKETKYGSVTVICLTIPRFLPVINQVKFLGTAYRFISRSILASQKIDIIHSHFSYPAGFLGVLLQKRKGIPHVITEHSWLHKHFRSHIHKLCVKYAVNNASVIIAVSSALKRDIERYTSGSVRVIHNTLDISRFRLKEPVSDLMIRAGILGGYSNYRKGLDILIRAMAIQKRPDIEIHVGGDGILLDSFKKLAADLGVSDNFVFHGSIDPAKVPDFLSSLDFFVLPSRDETFGVVLIEALASGLPVIATKCGGPEEIIDSSTGLLIQVEDVQGLSESIRIMTTDLKNYIGKDIREKVNSAFGPQAFLKHINLIYTELVNSQA